MVYVTAPTIGGLYPGVIKAAQSSAQKTQRIRRGRTNTKAREHTLTNSTDHAAES
jgi:hypothetical protein